jgi:putative phosphoesterase
MKIGIIADVHCNAAGLRKALDLLSNADELLCAGDAIYEYRFSDEVVSLLRDRGVRMVMGNHEAVFFGEGGRRAREAAPGRAENMDFLRSLPATLEVEVAGKRLLMAHGSPARPFDEYVYASSRALASIRDVDADFVVLGHTHLKMAAKSGRALVINPGSAGEGRDPRDNHALSCALLDPATGEVEFSTFRI